MAILSILGKVVTDIIKAAANQSAGGQPSPRVTSNMRTRPLTERSVNAEETIAALEIGELVLIIDVRSPREYAAGHVKESVNIPFAELASRAPAEAKKAESVVTVSTDDALSARACETLLKMGIDTNWLQGGIDAWNEELK